MLSAIRMFVVLGYVVLSFAVEVSSSYALVATSTLQRPEREVTYCYFGALRKDGRIMVNMVEGASGKVYSIKSTTPVTLNGVSVGQRYLRAGMPIILILRNRTDVEEVQVRTPGGN
jgi:hypothetical protein